MYKLETSRYATENIFTFTKISPSFFEPQGGKIVPWYNPVDGILFFKDAEAVFECRSEIYNISGNALIFLPANYFCRVTLKKEYASCYITSFFYDLVCRRSAELKSLLTRLSTALRNTSVVTIDDGLTKEIEALLISATAPPVDFLNEQININALTLSCRAFESCMPVTKLFDQQSPSEFCEVTDYILTHQHYDLTLDIISERFHYDKNYFCRRFKNETTYTFSQYLTICRISGSVEYLCGNHSVEETSRFCGYKNARAYIRAFTSIFGISPKDFAHNMKNYAFSSRLN